MLDFFMFYMGVGLIVNWLAALWAIVSVDEGFVEVDFMGFVLTIPIWPITIYNIITSLFEGD